MIAFNCKPLSANPSVEPLVFEWDERTGAVTQARAQIWSKRWRRTAAFRFTRRRRGTPSAVRAATSWSSNCGKTRPCTRG